MDDLHRENDEEPSAGRPSLDEDHMRARRAGENPSTAKSRPAGAWKTLAGKPPKIPLGHLSGHYRKAIPAVLILLIAIIAVVGLVATRPPVTRTPPAERIWTIGTTTVDIRNFQPDLKLLGEIVAGQSAELRPLVAGRVDEVGKNYVNGGKVQKGDLLVAIEPFDYELMVKERTTQVDEARARLDELTSERASEQALLQGNLEQLDLQKREVGRRESLRSRGTGTPKALDDSKLRLSELSQAVVSREKTIAGLVARIKQQQAVIGRQQVALERALRDLEKIRLVAPFDGFVSGAETAIGKQVGTSDKIATLIAADRLEARFHMSDSEYARLVAAGGIEGRKATVIWRAQARNFVYDAVIERTESQVTASSGGIDLYARIDGIDLDTLLRPGVFVEVAVPDREYLKVARLPQSAVHGGDTVYIVKNGRLEPRVVEIMTRISDEVLVQGDLRPGDTVATTSFAEIGPGVKVRTR